MSLRRVVTALAVFCVASGPAISAQFWEKKPFSDWSKKECGRLLTDSPWAYPYAITGISAPGVMRSDGRTTPDTDIGAIPGGVGDREVHLFLLIRFVTARPVKAAIGRSRILAQPENQELVQMVSDYVSQPEAGEIIAEVTFYSEPPGHPFLLSIQNFLRSSTVDSLRGKVDLSSTSTHARVPLSRYVAPGPEQPGALLFFSRLDDAGNRYFHGTEPQILFHMETSFGLVDLIMKPKEMKFEGDFTF